jgi:cytochrome c-type biogenesis protein CcmE
VALSTEEEGPAEESPVDESPVGESPVEESPVDESPVDEDRGPAGAGGPGRPAPARFGAAPRRRPLLGSRRRQVVALLVIAGAVTFLLLEGLNNATVYFKTADQAVADKAALGSRQFRIEGTVEPGVRQVGTTTDFSIYANGVRVNVVDRADPPELFKPGIPVVLEGHWDGAVYASDQIMVKHTANYVEAHPERLKSQLPTPPTT